MDSQMERDGRTARGDVKGSVHALPAASLDGHRARGVDGVGHPRLGCGVLAPSLQIRPIIRCATVCYMSEPDNAPARVGVRELRQNLSIYLDRVKAGETLEVTEHGQPVAQLGPRPTRPLSRIDQLIAEGRITPATIRPRDIPPPLPNPHPGTSPLTDELLRMREEDDR